VGFGDVEDRGVDVNQIVLVVAAHVFPFLLVIELINHSPNYKVKFKHLPVGFFKARFWANLPANSSKVG
jgi:hypothetical protein